MDRTEERRKDYESPCTKQTQVEMEEGVCLSAASRTGEPVVDDHNNKVSIDRQGNGSWDGTGDDINVDWN